MIRTLVIGSILLVGQVPPAFAEIVALSCTDLGSAPGEAIGTPKDTIRIVFDTDAHLVTDEDNKTAPGTYPMEMTDKYVKWQSRVGSKIFSAVYDRNSARLTVTGTTYNVYDCVKVEKPF